MLTEAIYENGILKLKEKISLPREVLVMIIPREKKEKELKKILEKLEELKEIKVDTKKIKEIYYEGKLSD